MCKGRMRKALTKTQTLEVLKRILVPAGKRTADLQRLVGQRPTKPGEVPAQVGVHSLAVLPGPEIQKLVDCPSLFIEAAFLNLPNV